MAGIMTCKNLRKRYYEISQPMHKQQCGCEE